MAMTTVVLKNTGLRKCSSCEHDAIDKDHKNFRMKSEVSHIVQPTVYDSHPPPLVRYMWYLSSSCCSEIQCAYIQLRPFYHLSAFDLTHMRKNTRPFPFFMQLKQHGPESEPL